MNEAPTMPREAVASSTSVLQQKRAAQGRRARETGSALAQNLAWGLASLALMLGTWALISATIGRDLPSPLSAAHTLSELLRNPFGEDADGARIGVQMWASIKRVLSGFVLGSVVAIPLGVLMGSSPIAKRLFDPIVQILRPVSPLVWFPLALVTFKALGGVQSATLFTIFITSLWPTLINTAFGVGSLPDDYKNVARVFQFSKGRYLRRIVLPYALPHILTGLRLSMGVAWLVIVAAEMLSGDMGVGFFAWESYNAGSYDKMVAAVVLIGIVGLILDRAFDAVSKKFAY